MTHVSIWKFLIIGPVVFFLPGAALIMYIRDRYEANLLAVEVLVLSLCSSLLLAAGFGLVMAELKIYSLTRLCAVLLALTVALLAALVIKRRGMRPHGAAMFSSPLFQLALVAIALTSGFLFIGRWEAILTERDVSPYLVEGINIAQHGEIFLKNSTLARLTPAEASILYGPGTLHGEREYVSGFLVKDQKTGTIETRYFPMYSVLLAIGLKLFGLRGALTVFNPYISLLAVLAVVLALKRLLGPGTAVLSGILLAVSPLSVWFARYPISEMFAMMVTFFGIFALLLYYPRGNGYWGALAALAFGIGITTRFELYPLLVPLAVIMAVFIARSIYRKEPVAYLLWFIVPFGLLLGHSLYSHIHFNSEYFFELTRNLVPQFGRTGMAKLALGGVVVAAAGSASLTIRPVRTLAFKWYSKAVAYWRPIAAAAVAVIFYYLYLVRPLMVPGRLEKTLFRMSWYFTHVGLALAAIGLVVFVLKSLNLRTMSFFLICGFFAGLLFYKPACNPLHVWYIRRFIPAAIPFMIAMIAYAVVKGPGIFRSGKLRQFLRGAGAVAFAVVIVFACMYTAKLYPVIQYDGALKSIGELDALLGNDGNGAIFYGKYAFVYYTDLMRYAMGTDAVPLTRDKGDPKLLESIYSKMKADGKKVFLVGSTPSLPRAASTLIATPVGFMTVRLDVLNQEYEKRPEKTTPFSFPLYIYEVKDRSSVKDYDVRIGEADSMTILSGFYFPEVSKIRWTAGRATFRLPNIEGSGRQRLTMEIALGARPIQPGQTIPMRVYAQGKQIGTIDLDSPEFKSYSLDFDAGALADPQTIYNEYRLDVPAWVPGVRPGMPRDDRPLGVCIRRISVAPAR